MEEGRLLKQTFYGKLTRRKKPQHKPRKRFKDVIKGNLKILEINLDIWETLAESCTLWRETIKYRCNVFEQKRMEHAALKRSLVIGTKVRKRNKCQICERFYKMKVGLKSHLRAYDRTLSNQGSLF
uniref:C2H2-type domain-containing protein n=1 Tax=Octopus bimaculoides TaxID=37653 RepID=A0A0L8I2D3_OCTBM